MAVGLSAANANAILNRMFRGAAWTPAGTYHIKLHVGDPGAAGANNAAGNTTRVAATFGTDAVSGLISNTADLDWTGVSTGEDYTHWSAWDAGSGGVFQFSGLMTANAILVGDNFKIPTGDLDISFAVAA